MLHTLCTVNQLCCFLTSIKLSQRSKQPSAQWSHNLCKSGERNKEWPSRAPEQTEPGPREQQWSEREWPTGEVRYPKQRSRKSRRRIASRKIFALMEALLRSALAACSNWLCCPAEACLRFGFYYYIMKIVVPSVGVNQSLSCSCTVYKCTCHKRWFQYRLTKRSICITQDSAKRSAFACWKSILSN